MIKSNPHPKEVKEAIEKFYNHVIEEGKENSLLEAYHTRKCKEDFYILDASCVDPLIDLIRKMYDHE